jgi:hypothetical protein
MGSAAWCASSPRESPRPGGRRHERRDANSHGGYPAPGEAAGRAKGDGHARRPGAGAPAGHYAHQGGRTRLPLAAHAGDRPLRHDQRTRRGREDQLVLRLARADAHIGPAALIARQPPEKSPPDQPQPTVSPNRAAAHDGA